MPTKRPSGSRSEVIRCPNCGEDYSVTYKRCPFCDERAGYEAEYYEPLDEGYDNEYIEGESDEELRPRKPGGKRLVAAPKPRRGGGYGGGGGTLRIAGTILSLAIIVAAVWIVTTQIAPLVNQGQVTPPPATDTLTPDTTTPVPTPTLPSEGVAVVPPANTDTPVVTPSPQTPAGQATDFSLSGNGDFTLSVGQSYTIKPVYVPVGTTGTLTWSVDKPEVATVDASGKVAAVGGGTANVTTTLAGGGSRTTIVRVSGAAAPGASTPPSTTTPATTTAPSGNLTQSHKDVTLSKAGESFKMKISGTSDSITWMTSDAGIASVTGDGTITAVAKGTCTITAKVDGQSFKCTVRCSF